MSGPEASPQRRRDRDERRRLSDGFDFKVTERVSIGLQLEAEFSQNEVQLVGAARVRFAF